MIKTINKAPHVGSLIKENMIPTKNAYKPEFLSMKFFKTDLTLSGVSKSLLSSFFESKICQLPIKIRRPAKIKLRYLKISENSAKI